MTRNFAKLMVTFLLAALFFGTLMPGAWKDAGVQPFAAIVNLAVLAHVVLFAAICFLLQVGRFWALKPWHVPAVGLALALATEGLQFFAIDRHPDLAGVLQDLVGTAIGWAMGRLPRVRLRSSA